MQVALDQTLFQLLSATAEGRNVLFKAMQSKAAQPAPSAPVKPVAKAIAKPATKPTIKAVASAPVKPAIKVIAKPAAKPSFKAVVKTVPSAAIAQSEDVKSAVSDPAAWADACEAVAALVDDAEAEAPEEVAEEGDAADDAASAAGSDAKAASAAGSDAKAASAAGSDAEADDWCRHANGCRDPRCTLMHPKSCIYCKLGKCSKPDCTGFSRHNFLGRALMSGWYMFIERNTVDRNGSILETFSSPCFPVGDGKTFPCDFPVYVWNNHAKQERWIIVDPEFNTVDVKPSVAKVIAMYLSYIAEVKRYNAA